ncbi:MAG: AI-2E family transporter [Lachnospiraceae bacterium]|nr:AI-2E family transporter [Lachnospiraceae bacterium]MDD7178599.1 AI-2E family transporter [bacterium]MDY5516698.1 AI-2E family transporter [Lachnospiraceae bacterium]
MSTGDLEKNQNKQIFKHTLVQASAFLVVILCAILFFFVIFSYDTWTGKVAYIVSGLKSIIIGIAIAYLLNPIVNSLEKRLHKLVKNPKNEAKVNGALRAFSAIAVVLFAVVIVGIMIYAILPQVVISISSLIRNFPYYVDEITDLIKSNRQLQAFLDNVLTNATEVIADWLNENVLQNIQSYVTLAASGVMSVVVVLADILVGLIISVYVLCSTRTFVGQGKKIVYALFNKRHAKMILDTMRKSNEIFGGFISGKLLDSLIIGVLCFVGLSAMHMPYIALVSVIVGVTNVIPFFGPYIGMIPSTILIMLVDFKKGVIVLLFIIVLQQIDGNVIGPKILGKSTGLSAFWVVFSVMFFGKLWGIIGMLIGVPVFGVIYYILDTFVNFQLGRRELPVETEEYKNLDYFAEDGTRVTLDGKKSQRELRKEEQKELRRQWMEENQENFERWLHQRKKKEDDEA